MAAKSPCAVRAASASGKTRVFELLSRLVFRGFSSSNLSAPALFRTLHEKGGTLLLDEAERLMDSSLEVAQLRSILLAGYKRGGRASRLETAGENYQMSEFQVFGPKAIACISSLPGPLASRCIPVQMFRSSPDSPKPRRRIDEDPERWQKLRDDLYELTLSKMGAMAQTLCQLDDTCPLGGRHYELWQPILALAEWIDVDDELHLYKRLREYAVKSVEAKQEEHIPEVDLSLLRSLTEQVVKKVEPTSGDVLKRAQFGEKEVLQGHTARKVREILGRYGLITVRTTGGRRIFRNALPQLQRIERN